MNLFDTPYFVLVAIPIIWIFCSARWGARVTYLMTINGLINGGLKHFFALPRPCELDPSFCMIPLHNYSFPSGGGQSAALLGGLLFFSAKSKKWKAIAIVYFILLSFSRVYLGVHYPRDVIAGWFVGGAILWAYFRFGPQIEAWISHLPSKEALLYGIFLPWIIAPLSHKVLLFIPALSALGVGLWLSTSYHLGFRSTHNRWILSARVAYLFTGCAILYFPVLFFLGSKAAYPIGVLWISAGAGALWKAARLP